MDYNELEKMPSGGGIHKWYIDKEYALQCVALAYLGGKLVDLTQREAMIAHLAGYRVVDKCDGEWFPNEEYKNALGFFLDRAPHSAHWFSPPPEVNNTKQYQELQAQCEALKAELAVMTQKVSLLEEQINE